MQNFAIRFGLPESVTPVFVTVPFASQQEAIESANRFADVVGASTVQVYPGNPIHVTASELEAAFEIGYHEALAGQFD